MLQAPAQPDEQAFLLVAKCTVWGRVKFVRCQEWLEELSAFRETVATVGIIAEVMAGYGWQMLRAERTEVMADQKGAVQLRARLARLGRQLTSDPANAEVPLITCTITRTGAFG